MKRARPFALTGVLIAFASRDIVVETPEGIRSALAKAQAGDTIWVKPGNYDVGGELMTGNSGLPGKPITLSAAGTKGYAKLHGTGQVVLHVNKKHWVIRGIHVEGDKDTDAPLYLDGPGGAGHILLTDCKVSRGIVCVKSSRTRERAVDDVTFEHSEFFDSKETAIDLVSGDRWVLRRNYVHDYGLDGAVHYGIFLKGGGKNGIVEGNIVHAGKKATTIGISFGGGRTGAQWIPLVNGKLAAEHEGGICRNNIVIATTDVAYHTNNGSNCKFYNNLAYACGGFQRQASYPKDPVLVNNLIAGGISGASSESANNLTSVKKEWFADPDKMDFRLTDEGSAALAGKGTPLPDNPADFFGNKRASMDPGPVAAGATQSTQWVDRRTSEPDEPRSRSKPLTGNPNSPFSKDYKVGK